MPGESHKLDSVSRTRSLGAEHKSYEKATAPKPSQPNQVKPKGTGKERVGRVVIGEIHESTVGAPKEQIIKLKKTASPRGKGPGSRPQAGATIGRRPMPVSHSYQGVTSGMGGHRSRK